MLHRLCGGPAAAVAAVGLSVLLTGSVLAAHTWSTPSVLWAHGQQGEPHAFPGGLVALDGSNVVASYVRVTAGSPEVFIRRSTDGGTSWGSPLQVSRSETGSWRSSIAGFGNKVDVVITESGGASSDPGVRYTRSTDGGVTFSDPILLGSALPYTAHVARGPNGVVVVVWFSNQKEKTFVRVSHDSGVTFAPKVVLWKGASHATGEQALAVADGMIYVAATSLKHGVELRRSVDGVQWTDTKRLDGYDASGTGDRLSISAAGDQAFVGYVRHDRNGLAPSYRRTADAGISWSPRQRLAKPSTNVSAPLFDIEGGVVRAAFGSNACPNSSCNLGLFYRQSSDGMTWTPRELVSSDWSLPMGIGYTDRVVIGYSHYSGSQVGYDIEVRTGTD